MCKVAFPTVEECGMTRRDVLGITETYRYYNLLDDYCKSRIPQKFKDFLEHYKDLSMGEPIRPEIPLEMQNISQEGWNLIAQLEKFFK